MQLNPETETESLAALTIRRERNSLIDKMKDLHKAVEYIQRERLELTAAHHPAAKESHVH